jgi:hypothetical protein
MCACRTAQSCCPLPTPWHSGPEHTAIPIFRTIDNLLDSSGVMRAAAASGVMLAAASSLACFNLDSRYVSLPRPNRTNQAKEDVRSLGGARSPGYRTPAKVPETTESGAVALRCWGVDGGDAACQTGIADSLPGAHSAAAVEGGHSPYHPHLDKRQRTKGMTGGTKVVPKVGEPSERACTAVD